MNSKLFEKEKDIRQNIDDNFELKDRMELVSEILELEDILLQMKESKDEDEKAQIPAVEEEIEARENVVEGMLDLIADAGEYDEDMSKWEDKSPFILLVDIFPRLDKTSWYVRMVS